MQCCSENDAFFASTLAIQCNDHNFANVAFWIVAKNEIFLAILQTVSAAFQTVPVTSKFG